MTAAALLASFVFLWLFVCVILGYFSGWYSLMSAFPDRPYEEALAVFSAESGMVGPVSMHGILKLSPCRSGLRVGITKLFGPFSKDFLVPWDAITVSRKATLGLKYAELSLGTHGKLRVRDLLADRLWQVVPQSWPEKGAPQPVTFKRVFRHYFLQWLIITTLAAAFFLIAPRIMGRGSGSYPPVIVAVLFPATVFGIFTAFQMVRKR